MARIGTVIREVYRRPGAQELPGHLAHRYGLRVTGVRRLDAGVLRIDHEGGPAWVARLFVSSRPLDRVEEDAEVLRFLQRNGFPAERCAHPEPVSNFDGRGVLVTEFVEGRRPSSTAASRRRLGDLLGRLHTLPTEPGATRRASGSLHHLPAYEGRSGRDLAAATALLADLDGRVPKNYEATYDTLLAWLTNGDDAHGLPECFIHPDPCRANAVANADGITLVDWTGAGTGARLASFAVLLNSIGPQHADQIVRSYSQHARLTDEELDRIEGVLWVRQLWLACWQCWLAVVSPKVSRTFLPDPQHISAIAAQARVAATTAL